MNKNLIYFNFVEILCFMTIFAHSLDISPKISFVGVDTSRSNIYKPPVEVFHALDDNSKSSDKLQKRTVLINQNDDNSNENVVCKHDKCIVTVDATVSDKKAKANTVSTDVHVIVSSDVTIAKETDNKDKKNNDKTDGDVPVIKGYNGVKFEDINWNNDAENEKPKNENEIPSSIITSPYNGEDIIINPQTSPLRPNERAIPPRVNWNERYPNNNENRDVRIPSGWTSNWKPSYPPPSDYYHYNVRGDRNDFAGYQPTYRNVCKCTREPVYPRRSDFYPVRPTNPWYPIETTTKEIVDDKLLPPFSNKQKRNYN